MKNLNHELTEQELQSIAGGFRALNFSQRSFKPQEPRLLKSTKLNVTPKASIWQDMMN
jgi:bacteriocin-like protein